ncbi:ParB/RepB/Spo0J family partition protein [Sphingomonas sp.]|jgi:ParB family chromosome partitioning protein|uniref:ParB/RepB/Spo0J family partition protein n=1 Tax=Sphingomonas sp. TaxID=28214 RepID=UPI002E2F8380|nr:ParB/RepB/Spo0J family partition protein [Sphingomonas sp.]HEX4695365.1 ParB/RepB/Spo0J family partition protein [Sphingomonas sp.]
MSEPRKPRPGLGRGLNALLGDIAADPVPMMGDAPAGVRMMPVGALTPQPGQPRRTFDDSALEELAQSIAARGVLQPILVRPHGRNYQIVAGERRWRAAQRARLHEVPVIVRELDDADTFEIALLENIQRRDLNAVEEADAYQRLIGEFGHTQEALAKLVHKSRSHIANLLRLLDLPQSVQALLIDGRIDMGHARALIGAPDVERLAAEVVAKGLSVRETERLARSAKSDGGNGSGGGGGGGGRNADIAALERQLSDVIGLGVRITYGAKGGALTVNYSTLDQLDMVCQRLTGEPL